jgi:hypothetical protein
MSGDVCGTVGKPKQQGEWRKSKLAHTWQERQVLTFLQSHKFDHLVNSATCRLLCNTPGMVGIALTHAWWFQVIIWQSIVKKELASIDDLAGAKFDLKREVAKQLLTWHLALGSNFSLNCQHKFNF